jgi:hydroxypyruvate isomerase
MLVVQDKDYAERNVYHAAIECQGWHVLKVTAPVGDSHNDRKFMARILREAADMIDPSNPDFNEDKHGATET